MNPVSFSTVKTYLELGLHNISVLFRGEHGIGKSELVWQFGELKDYIVYDIRLGQTELGDLMGFIKETDGVTTYSEPWWWPNPAKLNGKKGFIIFFDEYNRGKEDVRNAAFQIILDRALYGKHFSKDIPIWVIACINPNNGNYQVGELDPANNDRFAIFDIKPTHEEWLIWAKEKGYIHPDIIEFIANKDYSHLLFYNQNKETSIQPSPRSWARWDKAYKRGEERTDLQLHDDDLRSIAASFIGIEAASAFIEFLSSKQNEETSSNVIEAKTYLATDKDPAEFNSTIYSKWDNNQKIGFITTIHDVADNLVITRLRAEALYNFNKYLSDELKARLIDELKITHSELKWENFFNLPLDYSNL